MDVVRTEVQALGGRIETSTEQGRGTRFKLVLPLTTAVTQVVVMRSGSISLGVPANLVELVRRVTARELQQAYFLEARVESGSTMIGRSIEENRLRSLEGLFLLEIVRDGRLISPVTPMGTGLPWGSSR